MVKVVAVGVVASCGGLWWDGKMKERTHGAKGDAKINIARLPRRRHPCHSAGPTVLGLAPSAGI